jgi:multiple antibiotic resistance protein
MANWWQDLSLAAFALIAIGSILAVMEPFSTVAVFISLARDMDTEAKKRAIFKSMRVSFLVLIFFAITGNLVFKVFNITVAAFEIAGGLLLITVAIDMLRTKKDEYSAREGNIAIVPLAFPLTAGPGAITTVIVLTQEASDFLESSFVFIGVAIAILVSYIALRYSGLLSRRLKGDGLQVVTALMAIIVLAIAVQFIINGVLVVAK